MASKTTYTCDLCGKEMYSSNTRVLPVAFITEQTEGRPTKPYISNDKVDVCSSCLALFIDRLPVVGEGAQGYNVFRWRNWEKS